MSDVDFNKLARSMSGRRGMGGSAILIVIALLIGGLAIWAHFAQLDKVTRGDGRVVSSVQNQMVQSTEAGVILRRYVSENSQVLKGDVLFEIDPVDATSELNQINTRLAALELKEARLRAEISGSEYAPAATLSARAPTVALTETSLFTGRKAELAGRLAVLEQRKRQRAEDLQVAQASLGTAERLRALLEKEIAVVQPLVEDNLAPATRLLELQRQLEQELGAKERQLSAIVQAQVGIEEISSEMTNVRDAYKLSAMKELNGVVSERSELLQAIPLLEDRVSRTIIRAPMDGIVNKLNFRTLGGYVNTGDVVLELVPTGEALVIEGRIAPKDISNIAAGDDVRIRFSAYDSAKYGTVDGRVLRISPDATVDPQNDSLSFYLIDVEIASELFVNGEPVPILPGMTATIDVLSGKRSVLEYVWQPVARVQELALRD